MKRGYLKSKTLDGDDKLFLSWFKHRENVEYSITYFDDHYEINWESDAKGIQKELREFIRLIVNPDKRIDS